MTQKEDSGTHCRNSLFRIHGISARASDSAVASVQQSDICGPGVEQSNRPLNTEKVLDRVKRALVAIPKVGGGICVLTHLLLLMAYSVSGLASSFRDKAKISGVFIYGSSIIHFFFYLLLYCSEVDKLPFSIFEKGEKDSRGTYCAKVVIMGIILPAFNFIGLIVLFKKDEKDWRTFNFGIAAFAFYLAGNTLLLFRKRTNTGSEEHELRENNPPAENSTANDALTDNLPAANQLVGNTPADNASTTDSPADNAQVDNLPAGSSPVDNSSADSLRSVNPPVNNSRVGSSRAGSSPASNSPVLVPQCMVRQRLTPE